MARVEEGNMHQSGIMVEGDALKVSEVKTSSHCPYKFAALSRIPIL